jgi:hypothetical protein
MQSSFKYGIIAAFVIALVVVTNIPVFADTYHIADFSGAISGGSANCKPPFDTIISQGGPISGHFLYDDQLIPGPASGVVNVFFSNFPDAALIPAATAFTIDLGATVLTFTLADAIQNSGAIQYNNGQFNGFFFATDFAFLGDSYRFNDQGFNFNIKLLDQNGNVVPLLTPKVNGRINFGDANLTNIQPFTPSTPVPEPATLLLLGSGLAGFVGFGKKFRRS